MLLETIIASLVPIASEGIKQGISKWLGGPQPVSVEEQIKIGNHEIEKLKAIAELDNPGGTPSQWVIDLRGSARYLAAIAVIGVGISSPFVQGIPEQVVIASLEAANIVFGFLFGSRIVANWKK